MVAVVFGQSNSANYLGHRNASRRVVNYFGGRCYLAQDPLLGATGPAGSVWVLLGEMLLDAGDYDSVVLIPVGMGGTSIMRWREGGDLNMLLSRELSSSRYTPTHFLWHQGESDSGATSGREYEAGLRELIETTRRYAPQSSFYVSIASFNGRIDQGIRAAQLRVVDSAKRVFAGPDTDTLTALEDRHDGLHFSMIGQRKFAGMWLQALRAQ
jgi:hypothetical protein